MKDKKLEKANKKFEEQKKKRPPSNEDDGAGKEKSKDDLSEKDFRRFLGCGG